MNTKDRGMAACFWGGDLSKADKFGQLIRLVTVIIEIKHTILYVLNEQENEGGQNKKDVPGKKAGVDCVNHEEVQDRGRSTIQCVLHI